MSRPGVVRMDGAFRVKGLGRAGTVTLEGEFAVSAPEPTKMFWDGGDWRGSAQRAWTGTEWFPPLT